MKTEVWDLRHWKSKQLDLFLVRPIHTIIESNPMITDEIIDLYAKRIAKEIDEEILENMTRSLGEYSKTAYGMDC